MNALADDLAAFALSLNDVARDEGMDPSERVAALRRKRDLIQSALDLLPDGVDAGDYIALLGQADMYIGDCELQRDADTMSTGFVVAEAWEAAVLRQMMIARGIASVETLNEAGWPSVEDLDQAERDGRLLESVHEFSAMKHPRRRDGEFRDVALGVTPFRGKGKSQDDDYYLTSRYKGFERAVRRVAQEHNVKVTGLERVRGVWEGGGEPSAQVTLCCDFEAALQVADRLGSAYNQDGALFFHANPDGKGVRYVSDKPVDRPSVETAMMKAGLPGATFLPDGRVEVIDPDDTLVDGVLGLSDVLGIDFGYEHGDGGLRLRGRDYSYDPVAVRPGIAQEAASEDEAVVLEGTDPGGHDPGDVLAEASIESGDALTDVPSASDDPPEEQ